jgi:hypothetical protein
MNFYSTDVSRALQFQRQTHASRPKRERTRRRASCREADIRTLGERIPAARRILCVGARDDTEVRSFVDAGYDAVGIDIAIESEIIIRCDAHKMACFDDQEFDAAYCSHSLEHAYDAPRMLSEIRRAARFGAFMILPMRPTPSLGHPSVFEIMRMPENVQYFQSAYKDSMLIWNDFASCHSFEVLTGGYRYDDSGNKEEREVYFLISWMAR